MTDTCTFPDFKNAKSMSTPHKNKTFATFLALILGGLGVHRFYLRGPFDKLGLMHLCSLPIAGMVYGLAPETDGFFKLLPITISYIAAFLEALILGVSADEKFDAQYNPGSGKASSSRWILAVLLVTTMIVGSVTLIGTIARVFDLLYTGGAYG